MFINLHNAHIHHDHNNYIFSSTNWFELSYFDTDIVEEKLGPVVHNMLHYDIASYWQLYMQVTYFQGKLEYLLRCLGCNFKISL